VAARPEALSVSAPSNPAAPGRPDSLIPDRAPSSDERRERRAAAGETKLWIGALDIKVTQPPAPASTSRPAAAKRAPRPPRASPDRIARPFGGFGIRQS
jgi:hypothetical protein